MNRLDIPKLLNKTGCQGLVISHSANIMWATGLTSSNALLYIDGTGMTVVTDSRYIEAARKLAGTKSVLAHQESLAEALQKANAPKGRLGYQPEYISSANFDDLSKTLSSAELVPLTGLLRELVARKSADELALIQKAQRISEAVLPEILELLKVGISEKEMAAEIVYRQIKHGADGLSPEFWPIVAFGPNSALPHSQPGDTKLKRGDAVLFDFGCTVSGYCSDMTRTFAYGSASDKFRKVYELVLKAQVAGLAAVKAGMTGKQLDSAVRGVIDSAGYGEYFGHGTGHGVGLEIHEWPTISPRSEDLLTSDSVVTIEPGIYLPGEFGVRIEDMVLLEAGGIRNLTSAPKELTIAKA